jgi:3-oxoacyl-[acyl-carrier-protein] synthase-1
MIFLNSVGVINAIGNEHVDMRNNLLQGLSPGMHETGKWLNCGRSTFIGEVTDPLPPLPEAFAKFDCRNNRLLFAVLEQIKETVDDFVMRYGSTRIGVVLGTSTSGISAGEDALAALNMQGTLPKDYHYKQQEVGALSELLSGYLGLKGPSYTLSTACSSSARAFISAKYLLVAGICDAVIVGGVDTLCRLTLNGFDGLESISQEICNPLSFNRDGINIGEGAALFLLSKERGLVALLGVGESSDAYHVSAPDPNGKGAAISMQKALVDSGLSANDIGYVNLHGTATKLNDLMEARAVADIVGLSTPCSSTKPLTGHTLGAAGAIEAALCWLVLTQPGEMKVPPHLWDGVVDPELSKIRVAGRNDLMTSPVCMSNSFAFGGNNVSLIFGRADDSKASS